MTKLLRVKLHKISNDFIKTGTGKDFEPIVRQFHEWMEFNELEFSKLTIENTRSFLNSPHRKAVFGREKYPFAKRFLPYLEFLFEREEISFDPDLMLLHPKKLPDDAKNFLNLLRATHKDSTINGYRTDLRKLYNWIRTNDLTIQSLNRNQVSTWRQHQADEGYHPVTRWHTLNNIRIYFRWLKDQKKINCDPDKLITTKDFPKQPKYLPRPFPPKEDAEIQEKLNNSESRCAKGLLLMRHTGMRIGELIRLCPECIKKDENGHTYLKIPLGKMNSERLVPLNPTALTLIQNLQKSREKNSAHLFEKGSYNRLTRELKKATNGMTLGRSATTHRFRHTYATELLNAGMSLVGVMRLLGHNDHRMTLRYAEITFETVGKEYYAALEKLKTRRHTLYSREGGRNPAESIHETLAWLKKIKPSLKGYHLKSVERLIVRTTRIKEDIEKIPIK